MEFNETIQCDEVSEMSAAYEAIQGMYEEEAPAAEARTYTLLSEHLVMIATVDASGKLLAAQGFNAKVEQVEMNMVKVTKGTNVMFLELGEDIQWIKEREV